MMLISLALVQMPTRLAVVSDGDGDSSMVVMD